MKLNQIFEQTSVLPEIKTVLSALKVNNKLSHGSKTFYDTNLDDIKVVLDSGKKFTQIALAWEQRPGVYHDLGNFPDDERYKELKKQIGFKVSGVRSDLGSDADLLKHAKLLASKLGD